MTRLHENKVALITGAGAGIGEAVAVRLARLGAHVIILDVDADATRRVCDQINVAEGKASACALDVSEVEKIEGVVSDQISRHGKIDMLVNCAGIRAGFTSLVDINLDLWDHTLRVNLTSALMFSQAVAKDMIKRGEAGWIVNITSAVAFLNGEHGPAYACSKAALHHLTKVSATELAPHNILVNSVAPGLVETPGVVTPNIADAVKPGGPAANPLERVIQPDEIADAVLFLLSPQSKSMTGQVLHVSGGGIM